MSHRAVRGFTLIELLIVIVIIGIIAAIAIPSLLRARVSANEAACIADIRTVLSAQAGYRSANAGHYDQLNCLSSPSSCIPNYAPSAPTFLDANLGRIGEKQGYRRFFNAAPVAPNVPPAASPSSIDSFVYGGVPITPNRTGVRGFGGDDSGRICSTPQGTDPAAGAPDLPAGCSSI